MIKNIISEIICTFHKKRNETYIKFKRVLPFGDYFSDRWEKAKYLEKVQVFMIAF